MTIPKVFRVISVIVVVNLLYLTGAMAVEISTSGNSQSKRIVLLVDEIKAIRNFPLILADRLGYLNDDGIVVTVMNIRDDVSHSEMLMDGRIDAVMAYFHHNIVNQSQGKFSQAIVTLGVTPGAKIMIAKNSRYRSLGSESFAGSRVISGGDGSSKTTVANYWLLGTGLKVSEFTRLPTGTKESNAQTLRSGAADFVIATTPDGDYYETQGVASVFADLTTPAGTKELFGELFPSSTIFMKSSLVAEQPWIAQHLATVFVKTLQFIQAHSAEEILALIPVEISGKDRNTYLRTLSEERSMFLTNGLMDEKAALKEWNAIAAINSKVKNIDISKTYTNQFVEKSLMLMVQEK